MSLHISIIFEDTYHEKAKELHGKLSTFGYSVSALDAVSNVEETNLAIVIFPQPKQTHKEIIERLTRNGIICIVISDSVSDIPSWYKEVNKMSIETSSIDDCFEALYAINNSLVKLNG